MKFRALMRKAEADDERGDGGDDGGDDTEMPHSPLMHKLLPEGETATKTPDFDLDSVRIPKMPEPAREEKAVLWDPFAVVENLGYKAARTSLSYSMCYALAHRTPIIQGIHKRRLTQTSAFSVVQPDKFGIGYRVRLRDRKAKPTPESTKRAQQLEQWIQTTGTTKDPRGRDSFGTFLKKFIKDSLIYDQACFEVIPDRKGRPAQFVAVDGSTIRLADSTRLHIPDDDDTVTRYVQVYDNAIISEYALGELAFCIRNPSTNIQNQGYGMSELEVLIEIVTAFLWGFDYNKRYFSQGTSAKGILNIKGDFPDKQLRMFRKHWYSMVSGIENAFRTPIINADEVQWLSTQHSNNDMEYNAWMDFLIKIMAAIYDMDPMEINFKYGDSGGAKSMFESANQSKLTASKDAGLKPLLTFAQESINRFLITPLDEDFVFEFVGLEAFTPAEQADLNDKLTKTIKTIDEARAEEDMPPLPNGAGAVIRDPTYLAHLQAAAQAANPPPDPNAFSFDAGDGGDGGGGEQGPPGAGGDEPAAPAQPAAPDEAAKSMTAKPFRKTFKLQVEV